MDRRTKNLVKRLKRSDIAIIDHDDIDEVAANSLIDIRPQAIINAAPSITGRYPARGVYKLLKAGIPVLDEVGEGIFEKVREGMFIEIKGNGVYWGKTLIAEGNLITMEDVEIKLKQASQNIKQELDRFVENTLEYAKKEKDILLGTMEIPAIETHMLNRHVLIVVRGSSYKEDLKTISSYILEEQPVLIGVDGGADALLEFGLKPDIIVGDMDSVSDEALACGAEIIVHAYADGSAPGLQRVESMGIKAKTLSIPGPIAQIITSAARTFLAASSPEYTFTASKSPPKACPAVTLPQIILRSFKIATVLLKARGRAAPSVIKYALR
jgi:uncharacterized membrane-anchored protein